MNNNRKLTKYTVKTLRSGNLYVYGGVGNKRLTVGWIGESFARDTMRLLRDNGHKSCQVFGGVYRTDAHSLEMLLVAAANRGDSFTIMAGE